MSSTSAGVVIAGGGQAGFQVAAQLRAGGYNAPIAIVSEEPAFPYQRPPLSKAYLLGKQSRDGLFFRKDGFYAENGIAYLAGERVETIDRAARTVATSSGRVLAYDRLVLATGARNRRLPVPGAERVGVHTIRDLADIDAIQARLDATADVVVIGGGFIGLEFAAVAAMLGKRVTVIEFQPRLMARAVPPAMSDYFLALHRGHGVDVRLSTAAARIDGAGDRVDSVETTEGEAIAADLVVAGVGVVPNIELAAKAGLACEDGILVDAGLRTSDPAIFALGDCARFPVDGGTLRLESVQNAVDQGRHVGDAILGKAEAYRAVPWFWSDQYDVKLQMVGLSAGAERTVRVGDPVGAPFSLLSFRGGRLVAVDSVNRGADHMAGRRLLESGVAVTPEQAEAPGFELRSLLPRRAG